MTVPSVNVDSRSDLDSEVITRKTYDEVMMPTYAPVEMIPERAEGSHLYDAQGNDYVDFGAGIAVSALGHCHPELVDALAKQAGKFWHLSNLSTNLPAISLAKKLCDLTFAEKVFLSNSGAEANEAALKLARRYAHDQYGPEKSEILAFDSAFHGRTFFTVSVGGQAKYSDGFGPKPQGISHVPFNDVEAVKAFFAEKGDQVCAVILEPVQGEGGVNPASKPFLEAIQACCEAHNALMIFDEIQCGVGRSGKMYVYQNMGITPDILTTAKGLGGGFPIAATLTTDKVAASFVVGTHGSTFGGNPMGCAVASKVLDIVSDPALLGEVERKSNLMKEGLMNLSETYHLFSEVRGLGLLLGCELKGEWKDRARDILTACMGSGLMILVAGTNVLRLAPALTIEDEDIAQGLERMERAIVSLVNAKS